ncbi:DUF4097 domain-containing protein [Alkaliphilus pronyensis]|uniref:DUF4097 domain-containing protein n=1 Tax=Alkaliphilus pronyensis TaxID=1482732 RepID=A0A6I0F8I0_9FIRM|nr:DUF4097 family beta strand repeat-containing protein [Alkaliphilus pronyensis]KAB3534378.1 DUF4097 domain-containing protein [Alkaliphilus pronyensis]
MNNKLKKLVVILTMALVLTGCTSEVEQLQKDIDKLVDIGENYVGEGYERSHSFANEISDNITEVKIDNYVGKINISHSSNQNSEVKVTKRLKARSNDEADIEKGLNSMEVTVSEEGNLLDINAVLTKDIENLFKNRAVDIDLSLPQGVTSIKIINNVGDVTFTEFNTGDISVKTNVGDVFLIDVTADDVEIKGNVGKINCYNSTVKGNISTSTGSIDIEGGQLLGDSEIQTATGSIDVTCKLTELGDYYFSSKTGSIVVAIDPELSFNIDAETGVGIIDNSIALDNKKEKKGSLTGTRNNGKINISVKTNVGSIRLIKFTNNL